MIGFGRILFPILGPFDEFSAKLLYKHISEVDKHLLSHFDGIIDHNAENAVPVVDSRLRVDGCIEMMLDGAGFPMDE